MSKIKALMNASRKWLKAFLALEVRKLDSLVAPIFDICVDFLNEFLTVLLALPSPPLTTSLSSNLNIFRAEFSDYLVVFNIEVNSAAILLKPWIKRQ